MHTTAFRVSFTFDSLKIDNEMLSGFRKKYKQKSKMCLKLATMKTMKNPSADNLAKLALAKQSLIDLLIDEETKTSPGLKRNFLVSFSDFRSFRWK